MNVTTHPFTPEEVMAFVDGELPADRAQSLSAHLGQCPECRELVASLRNTSQTISNWKVAAGPVNAQFEERPLRVAAAKNSTSGESLNSEMLQRAKLWTWKRWAGGLAVTAALGLLLLGITIPSRLTRSVDSVSLQIREHGKNSVSTATGFANKQMSKPRAREEKEMKEVQDSYQGWIQDWPMIARTVLLSIVVKDFDAARGSLDTILARHNGYVAGLSVATPQGAASTLQASLRIPAAQLVAAVAELKALGRVENENQTGEEVTQQHADLVARLKNSRETEQRLQDVLRTRTGKVKDVLEVEEEIARVRGEIEQMEAEQQTLEHRVNFATIDLKLAEEYKAQLTKPAPSVATQLRNAAVDGFRSAFDSLLALVLFFAQAGPTLLLWLMVLSLPAWLLWRRYQRFRLAGSPLGV